MTRAQSRSEENTANPDKNIFTKHYIDIIDIQNHIMNLAECYNKGMKNNTIPENRKNYINIIDNTNIHTTIACMD